MIAHLFNAPVRDDEIAVGVGTVGSSEAIMLAGLAFKRKWQAKRKAHGKPCDNPNIVTGANVQVRFSVFSYRFSFISCIHFPCGQVVYGMELWPDKNFILNGLFLVF